ncbi:MAG: 16S rRNA (cytidine(1402)-2'-O)-methyltransferase [Bacteroidetes bacterium]|nr:16S rRNA (cytidine(1402)-2'-O)-methyltransferase [Bacteroidota bacterium]
MPKLYIIPTPIGNLEDITLRALRILSEVDFILAEDTRTTGNLLRHYNISKQIISHHLHNEHKTVAQICDKISSGNSAALVSDAGTPAISDPGFLLVRECIKNDIEIECLPGPTALIPALVNSGFPCEKFCFEGFLPQKKGRQTRLNFLKEEKRTMIFYESPHRLLKTLEQFLEFFGSERRVSVSRELSKIHEENARGTISEVILHFQNKTIKGEIVIVLEGAQE